MQRITLFTFCLQYTGFEFLDFAGKFDILSFLLKSPQNMIYLDCDNDTDHDPLGPASSKTLEMRTFLKSNYGFVDNPAPVAKTVAISSKQ